MTHSPTDASRTLFRYGFYFSLLFFFYGTLFPFRFDFSTKEISKAWSQAGSLPYWDVARGRIPSVPDSVANILLTLPLGFLGFLHRSENGRSSKVWKWCALGLALGLAAEILQLAIPSRSSDVTDILNNGLGTFTGAALARGTGSRLRSFLRGASFDREHTYLWLLVGTLVVFMFAPFDFSLDVSQIISDVEMLRQNPWELGVPVGDGWVQMAGFALVGGLAGRMARSGRLMHLSRARATSAMVLLMPLGLEFSQLLVASHAPSLRDLAMEIAGAAVGWMAGLFVPALAKPFAAFVLLNLAITAAGLSPFHFVNWPATTSFQWIPFIEYYNQTTASALSDAMMGLAGFGLLAGLLQLSCRRCPRWLIAGYAMALAAGIEFAQLFVPSRYANITDILIAGLGAWIGSLICTGIEFPEANNQT
jgi:glycopeptide antibiotics resistance protein